MVQKVEVGTRIGIYKTNEVWGACLSGACHICKLLNSKIDRRLSLAGDCRLETTGDCRQEIVDDFYEKTS